MSQNLSSAAVVIGAFRVNGVQFSEKSCNFFFPGVHFCTERLEIQREGTICGTTKLALVFMKQIPKDTV